MVRQEVIVVAEKHIEAGIKKYDGKIDSHIQRLLSNAQMSYVPYRFSDGRILLVLPNNSGAFLYSNEQTLFEKLSLE